MSRPIIATLDGTVHGPDEPLIHADDLGVLHGDGVFETTLVIDGVPRDLDAHLDRLVGSAAKIDLVAPGAVDWRRGIEAVLAAWSERSPGSAHVLRLICTRGRESGGELTAYVMAAPVGPKVADQRRNGISVTMLSRGYAAADVDELPWLLTGAKTLSYAVNMAARRYAEVNGADDVVFIGTDGRVLEAATANVVIADGDTLVTPPPAGLLAGITLRRLFDAAAGAGIATRAGPLTPAMLQSSAGVWLVSSVRLLAPVIRIDGTPRPIGRLTGRLAQLLQVPPI